jgi:hypothetical protein
MSKVDVRLGRTVKYFDFRTPRVEGGVKITIIHTAPSKTIIEFLPDNISDRLKKRILDAIKDYREEII